MKAFVSIFCLIGCCLSLQLEACTGMKLVAKDGSYVHGRTLEFGVEVDISMALIPRGYAFDSTTPHGKGLQYTSTYAAVGAMAFDDEVLLDGINEKGLSVGTFYFPNYASYAEITPENQSKALSPIEFPNWILTKFATVDEVKNGLQNVVIAPTVVPAWGETAAPFHYIVYDRLGNCLVIEPIEGKLVTYDNKLGVFTNSPTFDWHMTNLRNYINLTPFNAKPVTLGDVTLEPFGEGSGMVGLPGDFSPPSRFVRAAIFSTTATQPEDAKEAIYQTFHILNQFDIPVGVTRNTVGAITYTDETQFTCVHDPQALNYYFRTYKDQTVKCVHLHAFDLNAKKIKFLDVSSKSEPIDISAQLK
jgi:choloylglycine hydrolase